MRRISSAVRRAVSKTRRGMLALAPWAALATAVATFAAQPDPTPIQPETVVAIASLAGVALSLGFAVALLIAQHTAERHVRLMFAEFRADRTWASTLSWFAIGVGAIVAAGLARPTMSTAWASTGVLVWLALLGARAFPRLLDSLDPVVLAERASMRAVRRLDAAKAEPLGRLDERFLQDAQRGIVACATMAHEALLNEDGEVLEAALSGIRKILVAYLRRSPYAQPTDLPIDLAFQRIDVIAENVSRRSQVILMPVFITELKRLGLEAARLAGANPHGNDPVTLRLNMILFQLLAASLRNPSSTAPSLAATTIADIGLALLEAGQPNGVSDHVRRLGQVALAAMDNEADHVAAAANHGLARIAIGLLGVDKEEVMPPSIFQEACRALAASLDRYIARKDGTLQAQTAVLPVLGPFAQPSLATIAIAAADASASRGGFSPDDFGFGADALVDALGRFVGADNVGAWPQSCSLDCLYSSVVGAFALVRTDEESARRIERWASAIGNAVLADEQGRNQRLSHGPDQLASVLLLAVYALPSAAAGVRERLIGWISRTVDLVASTPPGFARRRLVNAFVPAAAASIGAGEEKLATLIISKLGDHMRARLEDGVGRKFDPTTPMLGTPQPVYRIDHQDPRVVDALLTRIQSLASTPSPSRSRPRPSGNATGAVRGTKGLGRRASPADEAPTVSEDPRDQAHPSATG